MQWKTNTALQRAWISGATGFPFVDANMRELASTGFMSNRGRQNVASFLTKVIYLYCLLWQFLRERMLLDSPCYLLFIALTFFLP